MKKIYIIMAVIFLIGLPAGVCLYVNTHDSGVVHARDLGVHPSGKDLASARVKFAGMEAGDTVRLNSQELTAWLGHCENRSTPFRETQIKLNRDNNIEISGLLIINRLVPYASSHGMSVQAAQHLADQMAGSEVVPVYIHCCASVDKGHLELRLRDVQVQDVSIPQFILRDKQSEIKQMLQNEIQRSNIEKLSVEDSIINLQFNRLD